MQCQRLAWNWKNCKPSVDSFYHMDVPYSFYYTKYLHIDEYGQGKTGDTNEVTYDLLKKHTYVLNARLEYKGCRTNIPILQKIEEGYCMIYPFLSAYPKEHEAIKMKINYLICQKCLIDVKEIKIVFINKDYEREKEINIDALLSSSNTLFNKRNNPAKNVMDYFEGIDMDLDELIDQTYQSIYGECPKLKRSKNCTSGRRCRFYDVCFDDTSKPDDSILFLTTSQHKLDDYYTGVKHIKEMDISHLEGHRLQYAQFMASKNGIFFDKSAIIPWLSDIRYPISYLDFEWDTFAIPPYEKMKPFDVLCFQYSLHVEEQDGKLEHYNFFDTGDCRIRFIESLIRDVPKEGTILVYNMEGAEKLRLIQLANQFPEYKDELESIWMRMKDLSKPFETGCFYDNSMRGHYSLKKVMPVFSEDVSYTDLSIQNGLNAVWIYRTFNKASAEQQEKISHDISTYCAMDTYAEYIVYHGLLKLLKEDKNA